MMLERERFVFILVMSELCCENDGEMHKSNNLSVDN